MTTEEQLDSLIQLNTDMLARLDRIASALEKKPLPAIFPGNVAPTRQAIVSLTPDPEMLASAGIIKAEYGRVFVPSWRTALACPPGITTTLSFNIPSGWVTYRRRPVEISSSFYDPAIGVNVYSDQELVNPTAPMPLTGPFTIDLGEYVTQWTQLRFDVVNGAVAGATVSFQVSTYLVDKSFWDNFITPLTEAVRKQVEALIK